MSPSRFCGNGGLSGIAHEGNDAWQHAEDLCVVPPGHLKDTGLIRRHLRTRHGVVKYMCNNPDVACFPADQADAVHAGRNSVLPVHPKNRTTRPNRSVEDCEIEALATGQ